MLLDHSLSWNVVTWPISPKPASGPALILCSPPQGASLLPCAPVICVAHYSLSPELQAHQLPNVYSTSLSQIDLYNFQNSIYELAPQTWSSSSPPTYLWMTPLSVQVYKSQTWVSSLRFCSPWTLKFNLVPSPAVLLPKHLFNASTSFVFSLLER